MLTSEWRKSSRSGSNDQGQCVEARFLSGEWRKSSRSGSQGGQCVEARALDGTVQVRDTKLGEASPILDVSPDTWRGFVTAAVK
ncbi:hypothetical protein GCM10029992_57890 [Glycomyces albus]